MQRVCLARFSSRGAAACSVTAQGALRPHPRPHPPPTPASLAPQHSAPPTPLELTIPVGGQTQGSAPHVMRPLCHAGG